MKREDSIELGLRAWAAAFTALAPEQQTVARYEALTQAVDGLQNDVIRERAYGAKATAFAALARHASMGEHYDAWVGKLDAMQEHGALSEVHEPLAAAFAALSPKERTHARYERVRAASEKATLVPDRLRAVRSGCVSLLKLPINGRVAPSTNQQPTASP